MRVDGLLAPLDSPPPQGAFLDLPVDPASESEREWATVRFNPTNTGVETKRWWRRSVSAGPSEELRWQNTAGVLTGLLTLWLGAFVALGVADPPGESRGWIEALVAALIAIGALNGARAASVLVGSRRLRATTVVRARTPEAFVQAPHTIPVTLWIEAPPAPLWVRVEHPSSAFPLSAWHPLRPGPVTVELRGETKVEAHVTYGRWDELAVRVASTAPFGTSTATVRHLVPLDRTLHIVPRAVPQRWVAPPAPVMAQRAVTEDAVGARPHHRGDGMRSVHWKATARTGQLMTIERATELPPPPKQAIWLHAPMPKKAGRTRGDQADRALGAACAVLAAGGRAAVVVAVADSAEAQVLEVRSPAEAARTIAEICSGHIPTDWERPLGEAPDDWPVISSDQLAHSAVAVHPRADRRRTRR